MLQKIQVNTNRIRKILSIKILINNIQKIILLSNGKKIIWMIKGNAYGHGIEIVSQTLIKQKQTNFGVYELNEALWLDCHYKNIVIFILDGLTPSEWDYIIQNQRIRNNFVICLNKESDLDRAKKIMVNKISFHIFIETGFNWYGIQNLDKFLKLCKKLNISITGVCSHFIESDKFQSFLTLKQINIFNNSIILINKYFPNIQTHLGNSNALLKNLTPDLNFYRVGRLLYGHPELEHEIYQVIKIEAEILQIKNVKKGQTIGYNASFTAKKNMLIAIISAGYKDGLDRRMSDCGLVLVRNIPCPIIGNIAMNSFMIDVSQISDILEGEWVTITANMNGIRITDIANSINALDYELLSRFNLIH